jgi:SAM-dependent methyltransferase
MNNLRGLVRRVRSRVRPPDPTDHVGYNRTSWDGYAARWSSRGFRRSLAERGTHLDEGSVLGDEWSLADAEVERIVAEWIEPFVTPDSAVAEIGVGGGRVARLVAGEVARLECFDLSEGMLEHARRTLADHRNVGFHLVEGPKLPDELTRSLDFVYSFDVFVHLDLHTQWKYIQEIGRVLKPGGRAFLHTANLTAPGGWQRFAAQDHYTLDGHYFVTPEVVKTLVGHSGLRMIRESDPREAAGILGRDYLFVLESAA